MPPLAGHCLFPAEGVWAEATPVNLRVSPTFGLDVFIEALQRCEHLSFSPNFIWLSPPIRPCSVYSSLKQSQQWLSLPLPRWNAKFWETIYWRRNGPLPDFGKGPLCFLSPSTCAFSKTFYRACSFLNNVDQKWFWWLCGRGKATLIKATFWLLLSSAKSNYVISNILFLSSSSRLRTGGSWPFLGQGPLWKFDESHGASPLQKVQRPPLKYNTPTLKCNF